MMNINDFKKFFQEKAEENNISISEEECNKFYLYMQNLLEWNEKINLTAIKDEKEIIIKHFLDSIIIKDEIVEKKVLDIGSGAGFPGIPLKIMCDNSDILLMDAVNKKVNFMNDSIEKLEINNIKAVHCRAEDLAYEKIHRENYDIVISRAVANMNTLVEYMLPFVKIGGLAICFKGPNGAQEAELAEKAISKLGGKIEKIVTYNIDENMRSLIYIKKEKNTEQIYPRKQGKPLKSPLK